MIMATLMNKTFNCCGWLAVLKFQPLLSWQEAWQHDGMVSAIDILSLSLSLSFPLC